MVGGLSHEGGTRRGLPRITPISDTNKSHEGTRLPSRRRQVCEANPKRMQLSSTLETSSGATEGVPDLGVLTHMAYYLWAELEAHYPLPGGQPKP